MSSPRSKHRLVEPPLAVWRNTKLFHARDTRNLRGVVLRTVDGDAVEARAALLNVIHQAVDLNHPVIDLALPDFEDEKICLTSDIWPGETLEHRLEAGPLPVGQALDVARNLAAGLATLHACGLVHSGVHPANIWLAGDGGIRLLGLGLDDLQARKIGALAASDVAYLAPEVIRGKAATPASDVWALGTIFRECLTGSRTIQGQSTSQVIRSAVHQKIQPLTRSLPRPYHAFLEAAMQRDPALRIEDGDAAHRALLALPESEHIDPTRPLTLDGGVGRAFDSPVAIGQVIQGYELTERLGSGGMGIVYRARDQRLDRDVALKFLPVDFRNSEQRAAFEREARAASALDHPNICTIFGIDETPEGDTFIAMACYDGQSLADRLESGPLQVDEALEITEQLASGLAAAHDQGIVHRDIKPGNILFTGDGLAKIVDFGLSRINEPDSGVLDPGELYGTIGYVAPEVVRNEPFDHRADIWALGVVLYEMLSGRRTFEGDDLSTLLETLERDPRPLSSLVPELPAEIDAIAHKALARDPEQRYQRAGDLLADVRQLRAPETRDLELSPTPSNRWIEITAAVGIVLLVVAFMVWRPLAPSTAEPTAFVGLRNVDTEAWMAIALDALIVLELEAHPRYAVQPLPARLATQSLDRLQPDTGWSESALTPLADIAELLIGGSVRRLDPDSDEDPRLRASLVRQAPESGDARIFEAEGEISDLPALARRLIAGTLGPTTGPATDPLGQPEGEAGDRLQAALDQLRLLDAGEAEKLAEDGLAIAEHPRLRLAQAESLWELGREGEAAETLSRITIDDPALPANWRLYLRARSLDFQRLYPRAAALHRALWNQSEAAVADLPRDALLHAAAALIRAGEPQLALEYLDRLPAEDPRLALTRADAFHWMSLFDQQLAATEEAARQAESQDLPFIRARSLRLEATAQWRLGDFEAGLGAARQAAEHYRRLGHVKGQADAATASGILHYAQGDMIRAKNSYDRAAQLYASLGNTRAEARTLTNKALVLQQQGDLGAQIEVTERVLELFRTSDDKLAALITQVNYAEALTRMARLREAESAYIRALQLVDEVDRFEAWATLRYGTYLTKVGRLATARQHLETARDLMSEAADQAGAARAVLALARLLFLQGDLEQAHRLATEALPLIEQRGTPPDYSMALRTAAEIAMAHGDMDLARDSLRAAGEIRTTRIDQNLITLSKARLELAERNFRDADRLSGEALADFELRQITLYHGQTLALLARSALAQDQVDTTLDFVREARSIFESDPEGRQQQPLELRIDLEISELRALSRRDDETALPGLQALLAEVVSFGLVPLELETRLALGEAERMAGYDAAGKARLETLAAEARLKGFHALSDRTELAAR